MFFQSCFDYQFYRIIFFFKQICPKLIIDLFCIDFNVTKITCSLLKIFPEVKIKLKVKLSYQHSDQVLKLKQSENIHSVIRITIRNIVRKVLSSIIEH